jgi:hypothetical protein
VNDRFIGGVMTANPDVVISFLDADLATANDLAGDLAESLVEDAPTLSVTRLRGDPRTQDFGATIVIILGTTAVTALAKGVAKWLERRQDANLRLKRTESDGKVREITLRGQPSARTKHIIANFFQDNQSEE